MAQIGYAGDIMSKVTEVNLIQQKRKHGFFMEKLWFSKPSQKHRFPEMTLIEIKYRENASAPGLGRRPRRRCTQRSPLLTIITLHPGDWRSVQPSPEHSTPSSWALHHHRVFLLNLEVSILSQQPPHQLRCRPVSLA